MILITRHGNREDFLDEKWHLTADRPHDPALSPDGIVQAQELGVRLLQERVNHIFASPFLRTVETAHHVAETLNLPIKIEHGLSEWLNPEWFATKPDWLSLADMAKKFPGVDMDYKSVTEPSYPEKTESETFKRVKTTVDRLIKRFDDDFLLVGHGASTAGAAKALVPEPDGLCCALCCLIKMVKTDGKWVMELSGDTSHLSETQGKLRFH